MNRFILSVALTAYATVVRSNIWLSSYISSPFNRASQKSTSTQLCAGGSSVVDAARTKRLNGIKERTQGRYDLASMVDESESSQGQEAFCIDYDMFIEADEAEIDPPTVGQTITGTIIEVDDQGALLEIGGKMSGYLPLKEAALIPVKDLTGLYELGQEVTAEVIGTLKGMPVVSLRPYALAKAWELVIASRAADESFSVVVSEVNRGGAVCDLHGLKAFLPGSHCLGPVDEALIGKSITVKFLDIDENEGKLVVSQKRASNDLKPDLKRGEVVEATVTGLRPYGVFLEVQGGLAGLLHISQISSERVDNLEKLFTVGQAMKVMVIDHDKSTGRVALATKPLEQTPGEMLRDPATVFEKAVETARKYHERVEADKQARQATANDIVKSLSGASEGSVSSVAEAIESILASIVSPELSNENK